MTLAQQAHNMLVQHTDRIHRNSKLNPTKFTAKQVATFLDPANYAKVDGSLKFTEFKRQLGTANCAASPEEAKVYKSVWALEVTEVCPYCKKSHTHALMYRAPHCSKQKCIRAHGLAHT